MKIGDTVYVIGVKQTKENGLYSRIKAGHIYRGRITGTHYDFNDDRKWSLYGDNIDSIDWVLDYPLRELNNAELLVECHRRGIDMDDVPGLP